MSLNTVMKPHKKKRTVMIANGPRKFAPLDGAEPAAGLAEVAMLAIVIFLKDASFCARRHYTFAQSNLQTVYLPALPMRGARASPLRGFHYNARLWHEGRPR